MPAYFCFAKKMANRLARYTRVAQPLFNFCETIQKVFCVPKKISESLSSEAFSFFIWIINVLLCSARYQILIKVLNKKQVSSNNL